ncbi:RNA 2'-phosphotransferase [Tahibacter caeni]|uniref:RNA 2'-phosphotransferase n=1 Tax=Tahibacter caeni TaxID=1453545 RepID=UPI002147B7A1|nr:RNA 2'-phosphotransferase [Tahibacter caeni]
MNDPLPEHLVGLSKFLSLVLRHDPAAIGLALDANGWTDIDTLLARAAAAGRPVTRADFDTVVALNDKRRFSLSEDGRRVRAAQGHSVAVDLALAGVVPPALLFHGTARRFLEAILQQGLTSQSRNHVHLSADPQTATAVGRRHGSPVVLRVDTVAAQAAGVRFQRADNGVWLADRVPADCLALADTPAT